VIHVVAVLTAKPGQRDTVLQHFAATLKANVRESDIVGRLGGDEFGVILSHATATQAHAKADALAARLEAMPTPWQGGSIAVTFSYGAFQLNPGDSADLAIARADAAMYSHKKSQTRRRVSPNASKSTGF